MSLFFCGIKITELWEELHCFYTLTKIWVCFEKGKGSRMYYWRSRSQWLPSCLLSPPVVNSLVLFLPYKQNCSLQCNYYLTFASCLYHQNISFQEHARLKGDSYWYIEVPLSSSGSCSWLLCTDDSFLIFIFFTLSSSK